MHTTVRVLAPLLLFALASCDKSKTGDPTPPSADSAGDSAGSAAEGGEMSPSGETPAADGGGEAPATEPGAPAIAWKDKTFKQRQEFMGIYVMPKMRDVFKAHDAKQFGTFKCETCHGPRAKEVKFAMPPSGMYPLDPKDPVKGAMEYDDAMTKFMVEQVVPQMAELVGEPVGGKGKQGFFCMECHPAG